MKFDRGNNQAKIVEMDKMLPFAFDLPSASLIIINDGKKVEQMNRAMSDAVILGIDTETKPTFVPKRFIKGKPHPTSIIQIAVRIASGKECVFIVDLLKLSESPQLMKDLDTNLQIPLLNRKCIKMGQGLTNDIRELAMAYPSMKAFQIVHSVLETHDIVKYLQPVITNPISLKNLVKQYLHCDLLKTEQMSDWSRRPLTASQVHYAACDALVLLRLYDAMSCEIEEKLSNSEDSGSESETTASDHSAAAKGLMESFCRTVDFTKLLAQKIDRKPGSRDTVKRQQAELVPGLDLNNALFRGWQSSSQKQWLKDLAESTTTSQESGKKRSHDSEELGTRNGKRQQSAVHTVSSSESLEDTDESIPLPLGTGRHTVFVEKCGLICERK